VGYPRGFHMSGSTPQPTYNSRRIAIQLSALSALGPFCIDAYLPAMPEIAERFGVPMAAVQGTLTAYMIPFSLMTLWHGALSDSFGRRRVVLLGLAVFLFASLGCALAPSLGWLLAFRMLQGATAGMGMVVGRAIVRDLYDGAAAQRLMALVAIIFAIAPAIAPVIGGWLHTWLGWRSIFGFMVLYTFMLILSLRRFLPETLDHSRRQPFNPGFLARSYLGVLKNRGFMLTCVAVSLAGAGLFVYVFSAPVFLMKHLHVSETGFLWLFGPITAGIVTGNLIAVRLAGKISILRAAFLGCGVMLASACINLTMNLLMAPSLPWAVLPVFGHMLGMSIALPSLTLKAIDFFPNQRGLAASCQSFIQSTGNSLLSISVPLFWATSLSLSATQLAFVFLCALVLLAVVRVAPGKASEKVLRTVS